MDSIPLLSSGKVCKTCQQWKPFSGYHKSNNADGFAGSCKPCRCQKKTSWRQANLEEAQRRDRKRWQKKTIEHREALLVYWRSQYAANKVGKRAAGLRWQANHPETYRRLRRKARFQRRALVKAAGTFNETEWEAIVAFYDYRCLCCGEQKSLTVDHIKPLSRGGGNSSDNLQPLCLVCNSAKGVKEIDFRPALISLTEKLS